MKKHFKLLCIILFSIYACDDGGILFETDISADQVILISPSNDAEIASNTIAFNWETLEDAILYEIQVATPNFENIEELVFFQEDSLTTASVELISGEYQWRVKALNNSYETRYSTSSFSVINVEDFSENTILLVSPIANFVTNQTNHNLEWDVVENATQYRIIVEDDTTVIEEQISAQTNYNITFPEGELLWKVRAENGNESTPYTERNILIDQTAPNVPTLLNPANELEVTDNIISFEWNREVVEGSDEFDIISVYSDEELSDLVLETEAISPFQTSLEDGTYYWVVRSEDTAGNIGNSSITFTFTVTP